MADPEFNPDEQYIIAHYECSDNAGIAWAAWSIHFLMAALFCYGQYRDDDALVFTAFTFVILWRIRESSQQPKYFRITQSVLRKYAARVKELSKRNQGDE